MKFTHIPPLRSPVIAHGYFPPISTIIHSDLRAHRPDRLWMVGTAVFTADIGRYTLAHTNIDSRHSYAHTACFCHNHPYGYTTAGAGIAHI